MDGPKGTNRAQNFDFRSTLADLCRFAPVQKIILNEHDYGAGNSIELQIDAEKARADSCPSP